MPSLHDIMAKTAVAALVSQFGERGPDGNFLKLKYWPTGRTAETPLEWPGIAGPIRTVAILTIDGEERQETRTWRIERSMLAADGIVHTHRKAVAEDGDGQWNIDVDECQWDGSFVTLGLTRAARTAGNELRRDPS